MPIVRNEALRKRRFSKRPSQQRRGIEKPGFIHLPAIGQVPHSKIEYMLSERNNCWVKLQEHPRLILLTEPLAYFARLLPSFKRVRLPNYKVRLEPVAIQIDDHEVPLHL